MCTTSPSKTTVTSLLRRLSTKRTRSGRRTVKAQPVFVGNCPPSTQNLLISHLQSKEVLDEIFRHMFSGSLSSLTNSMSIIIVLVQRYANRRVESGDNNGEKSNERSDSFDASTPTANLSTPPTDSDTLEEPFGLSRPPPAQNHRTAAPATARGARPIRQVAAVR